ncbi:MAG: GNAT family N-acetyltransferase [Alphaproteobacteria bacterium]|nr:GNAT family N-acetyltransferase [Alphaproteobacteria bacterium]
MLRKEKKEKEFLKKDGVMIPSTLLNRPFLPIATERLTLRPLRAEDAVLIQHLLNDKEIAERLRRVPHPYTLQDAETFVAFAQRSMAEGKCVILAIIRRSDQQFMGVISSEGELGFWLGKPYWGQGYGTEATGALIHFCFHVLKQKKLKASALKTNIASRHILEKLEFREIGTKEASSKAFEGMREVACYAISYHDFITRYHALERPLVWVVAAILINEKGEMLVSERPQGKALPGVWELPGGKMELGETPEISLIRELQEELGIQVLEEDLEPLTFASYRYDTFHMIMPLYLCHKWEGIPHGVEGQNLAWVTYSDLASMPLPAADILPVHRLADVLKERAIWSF